MNYSQPQSSGSHVTDSDSVANEHIVVVDGRRKDLSNLALALSHGGKIKREPSLYPVVADLPTVENTDQIWASSSQLLGGNRTASPAQKRSVSFSLPSDDASANETKRFYVEKAIDSLNIRENDDDDDDSSYSSTESINRRTIVEVAPGVRVPLRGANETLEALNHGKVTQTDCVYCKVTLVVHELASMIMCPACEMISPLGENNEAAEPASLGLGLSLETLQISNDEKEEENHLSQGYYGEKPQVGRLKRESS